MGAVEQTTGAAGELSARDREILAFERQAWRYAGAKEQEIRELFGLTTTQYYQRLNQLLDTEAALAADPLLVKRLRRQRDARHSTRLQARTRARGH
ncbi:MULTISPECIES: DUF3263 domain-containing protein [Kytococcus]|uniref:DUF3263 domain-containing protein n=1 Tax=Kytococcus schroeteri TaxID=138300 RepID=A0A2I1PBW1_9MICO|nr:MULTISPECIES: DUF3263 domain-containing protein [Kytococcus]PKZ42112.1 DUF3263 domain-containing protein [Kytococcus schroeteri]